MGRMDLNVQQPMNMIANDPRRNNAITERPRIRQKGRTMAHKPLAHMKHAYFFRPICDESAISRMRLGQHGFSLIELLVMVLVISVLAAMLLPVLEQSLDAARTTQCLNNLKQHALAVQLYAEDRNGCFPSTKWQTELSAYFNNRNYAAHVVDISNGKANLKDNSAYCPSYGFLGYVQHWNAGYENVPRCDFWYATTYCINRNLTFGGAYKVTFSTVRNPSRAITFIESVWSDIHDFQNAYFNPRHGGGGQPIRVSSCDNQIISPSGGAPACQADGSVRMYTARDVQKWADSITPSELWYGGAKRDEQEAWVLYTRTPYYSY